jgi:transposase
MRPHGNADELERRRRRAVALLKEGMPRNLLAKVLGVYPSSLSRWRKLEETGTIGAKPHPGTSTKLSDNDCEELKQLLLRGATSYGWPNNLWTAARVGRLIYNHFGVMYHPAHISRILRVRLNWTCQKPVNCPEDRDDKVIEIWRSRTFLSILRDAVNRNAMLVFIDESGFMLEPNIRRTYAPRGKTPENRVSSPHSRISVAGAILVDPASQRVRMQYHLLPDNTNFCSSSIVEFVRAIHAEFSRPVTIIWDQIPIHFGEMIDEFLTDESGAIIEPIPPYAPELNPADGIWRYIKHSRLPNYTPRDLITLRETLRKELNRLRRREVLLKSFVRFTKLPIAM